MSTPVILQVIISAVYSVELKKKIKEKSRDTFADKLK